MTRLPLHPKPYQPIAIEHIMETPRCALWAGMGMGKGVAALTALSQLDACEDNVFPALAIGPLRVARDVWPDETAKWEHLRHLHCIPIVGTQAERQIAVRYDSPIYSVNYENLEWLVGYWGGRWPYRTVIADEATKLKSYRGSYRTSSTGKVFLQGAGGMRARALARTAHEGVNRFIELTGTPSPNGLQDLWGQIWFLDQGRRLGRTFEGFRQRWFRPKYNGYGIEPLPGSQAEIQDLLKDICLTIDAKDWFDLKGPIVNDIYVDLPPAARKIYRAMEKDMFAQIGAHTAEAFNAAAKTQKCLQLANGAIYTDPGVEGDNDPGAKQWKAVHSVKLEALDSVISEAAGAPVLVVYEFRSELARILKAYPRDAVDLSTTSGLKRFKDGGIAVGLAHPASLGHGVDGLQKVCNHICFFGHNWNLELYDQIIGRIDEIRQIQANMGRGMFLTRIIARDTVDDDVMERRDSKREVQDILLESMKRRRNK